MNNWRKLPEYKQDFHQEGWDIWFNLSDEEKKQWANYWEDIQHKRFMALSDEEKKKVILENQKRHQELIQERKELKEWEDSRVQQPWVFDKLRDVNENMFCFPTCENAMKNKNNEIRRIKTK